MAFGGAIRDVELSNSIFGMLKLNWLRGCPEMYIMEAGSASFAMTGSMNLTNPKSIEAAIFTTDSKLFDDHKNNFLYELKSKSKPVK